MEDPRKKTKRYLKFSFGLHAGIFLLLVLGQYISPSRGLVFQPSVQIDMVALPSQVKSDQAPALDKTLPVKEDVAPPPPPPPEKDEPEPAPIKAPPPPEKDAEKRAKSALERMREEAAREKKNERKRQKEALNKREEDLKRFNEAYRAALRGNQKHEGTNSTGSMEEAMNAYGAHITEELRQHWSLPPWLHSQGLRAVARIYIDSSGRVTRIAMIQSSGNEIFDNNVKGAVQNSHFAPPPEEMAKALRNNGAEVTFPL
jgi:protein TonB